MTKHEQSVHTFNTTPSQVRSPPILPSGPTHCHLHHCAYCVRYHKVTLSTVWSEAVCTTQQVCCPERSTAQTSMNTPGAQTFHTTASHLIEHTHTHGAILHRTGTGESAPPHMLSGSANGQEHIALLAVPGMYDIHDIHIAFGQYLERKMKQTRATAEPEHHVSNKENITYNTKQPNIVHALCRLTHCSCCIAEGTVE